MQKLKIVTYKDDAYDKREAEYFVLVNPTEFKRTTIVEYGERPWLKTTSLSGGVASGAVGGAGNNPVTIPSLGVEPEKMDFELIFDATGAIIVNGKPLKTPIDQQIKQFKDAVLADGKPRFVQLEYGPIIFKCRLESMVVKYTLFRPNGSTLRASASVKFYEEKPNLIQRALNNLGKSRMICKTVGNGDVVDEAAAEMYQDENAYIQVAKENKIKFFRSLVPGMLLKK
jgi:hypothetical protein